MTTTGVSFDWWRLDGDRTSLYGTTGTRLFRVHIGKGRVWWACELGRDRVPLTSTIFEGVESARRARSWCEMQARLPKPRPRRRFDWQEPEFPEKTTRLVDRDKPSGDSSR